MTMIAYAFFSIAASQQQGEKKNQRATALADSACRAPRHP